MNKSLLTNQWLSVYFPVLDDMILLYSLLINGKKGYQMHGIQGIKILYRLMYIVIEYFLFTLLL